MWQAAYLVLLDGSLEIFETLRVHVIRPHKDTLLSCWHGKGANTSHDVAEHLTRLEQVHQSPVFCLQPAVPVHLGVVECKCATTLGNLDVHIIRTGKNFVLEGPVDVFSSNIVHLVDHRPYKRVLVHQDFCYELLIGVEAAAKVEMSCPLSVTGWAVQCVE